ncbi:MAG: VWA domain-containing protein [Saprospiraceae bacterium]|nr:MAG: VWA domain-containing protein [Saprospiraceae bacterium]
MLERLEKWRLVLGGDADPAGEIGLEGQLQGMDRCLEALYGSDRQGGLGNSYPSVNRWLGDIREYFPEPVVHLLQKDALERLDLEKILSEPALVEALQPDIHLVATILSLSSVLPQQTKTTARLVVARVVEQLRRRLDLPVSRAVRGSHSRAERSRRPRLADLDWHRTIKANLGDYQPSLKALIASRFYGHGRRSRSLDHVILLVDQSGSMAGSVVYAGIFGAILAGLPSLKTHFIAFDTSVVDLSSYLHDPVELLFGVQLGGGTDIGAALAYAQRLITDPARSILILISDLYEGGDERLFLSKMKELQQAGVRIVSLLALEDSGAPAFNHSLAAALSHMDIPAFACSPDRFPDLMEAVLKNHHLSHWMDKP